MATKPTVKTTFEPVKAIEPLYTGGDVSLDRNGQLLATCVEEDALIVNVESGERVVRIENDGESITSLALSPAASHLVVCSRSLAMRIYTLDGREAELQRTLKPHTTPVVTSAIDVTGTLLATGGADGTVKVWDIRGGYTTHTFQGHGGVITSLCFFQRDSSHLSAGKSNARNHADRSKTPALGFFLASGGEDGKIRIWNLHTRKSVASLDSHVSVVKSLVYSDQQQSLLSASRDRTIILWDVNSWKSRSVIPVLEVVEGAGFAFDGNYCYTGGENGRIRLWNTRTGKEFTKEQIAGTEADAIVNVQCGPTFLLSAHLDQTIQIHDLRPLENVVDQSPIDPLPISRRISGSHDEVIDLALVGPDRSLLALATNTESIRIVSIAESTTPPAPHFGADVALLSGHSEITICLDVDWSGHWLATGAKDNSARLWRLDPSNSSYTCFATFDGHTGSLGAVSLPRTPPSTRAVADPLCHPPAFLLTGSQDRTVKRWDTSKLIIPASIDAAHSITKSLYTRVAHEKDINAIDVSPTSPVFASASQDRTIKVWDLASGSVAGILRGHKRGVWSIRFAPKDAPIINTESGSSSKGLLLSGSGDRTVKLWSLNTYSCILTLEGHSNSVLKVLWLSPMPEFGERSDHTALSHRIPQKIHPIIASASSDSLIKLWSPYSFPSSASTHSNPTVSISDSHLLTTLDNHSDRVWALATPTITSSIASSNTNTQNSSVDDDISALQSIQLKYPLISGSADSTITFWSDTTVSTLAAATSAANDRIEQDQELQNHMRSRNYREGIMLALQLNHPGRLLAMLEDVMTASNTPAAASQIDEETEAPITGDKGVDDLLSHLSHTQLYSLLCRVRDWNTNARTAPIAQRVLNLILKSYPIDTFVQLDRARRTLSSVAPPGFESGRGGIGEGGGSSSSSSPSIKTLLRALEVYTDRHLRRMEDLIDESYLLDYTLGCMDDVLGVEGEEIGQGGGGVHGNGHGNEIGNGDGDGDGDVMEIDG